MNKKSKTNLFLVALLSGMLVVLMSSVVKATTITTIINTSSATHILKLYQLFLWNDEEYTVGAGSENLIINKWLIVWSGNRSQSNGVIVWWANNLIGDSSDYSSIAWWSGNKINWGNSIILWWEGNYLQWSGYMIVWWAFNSVYGSWIVLWWYWNSATWWVVLWWVHNNAAENSISMWSNTNWSANSFAWSATPAYDSAEIGARSWLLIGAGESIDGVSLVVSGAVKVGWNSTTTNKALSWEIRFVGNNCFYTYDGTGWHVMTTLTWWCTSIATKKSCAWGKVTLQHGDKVNGYEKPYSLNNDCGAPITLYCFNGTVKEAESDTKTYSPYCYNMK